MFKNKDSIGSTIVIVVLLSLLCSIIVAGSAVLLKPAQDEQKVLDKQKNILRVAGLLEEGVGTRDIRAIYDSKIEPRLVDLATGEYVASLENFDAVMAAKDPMLRVIINPKDDKARLRVRAKYAEVYLVKDSGKVNQIVLPIYGKGLWSVMYGFISISPDGNTINGITYYDQGETPGLGGEIENPRWQAQFKGKTIFDATGRNALHVAKGANKSDPAHGIDALSGATLTSRGVNGTFRYWFGENGFGPYLKKLQAEAQ